MEYKKNLEQNFVFNLFNRFCCLKFKALIYNRVTMAISWVLILKMTTQHNYIKIFIQAV